MDGFQIPELGDNLWLFSAVLAYFMPAVTSLVIRRSWGPEAKGIAAMIVSLVLGTAAAYVAGLWDAGNVTRSILIVFFLGVFMHRQFWKPSGIGPAIERVSG